MMDAFAGLIQDRISPTLQGILSAIRPAVEVVGTLSEQGAGC